jgi:hypothetical protein
LAEPDALCRSRDAALAEQGVERDEQVEIKAGEVYCCGESRVSQDSVGT